MNNQPRVYTYKITFEEVPYYYYGVHKEKVFGKEYWGSPVTNKWCWERYTPKKQILELFDYTDEGYIKAQEIEGKLIKPVYNTDKWCLNANCAGCFSLSSEERSKLSREIGLRHIQNKTAIFSIPLEERSKLSREIGLRHIQNKTAIFSIPLEERIENSKKGAQKTRELGLGIYALTPEQRIVNSRKSGIKTRDLKIGVHGLTPEQKSEAGKKGGLKNKENKSGVCGMSKEQRQQNVKKTNSQKWVCTETGFITNSGSLSRYQKARKIDTSNRVRLE
jgi:hypothetical protein